MPLSHRMGIGDRCRVDLVQPRRFLRYGDPSGEASSERNAYSLANFVLDTTRRSRHKRVRLLVEQQHRNCVHIKDLAHAGKQLDEQLIDIEARQRAVRQRLEARQAVGVSNIVGVFRQLGR